MIRRYVKATGCHRMAGRNRISKIAIKSSCRLTFSIWASQSCASASASYIDPPVPLKDTAIKAMHKQSTITPTSMAMLSGRRPTIGDVSPAPSMRTTKHAIAHMYSSKDLFTYVSLFRSQSGWGVRSPAYGSRRKR